jgi:signal transduction histidine kinase
LGSYSRLTPGSLGQTPDRLEILSLVSGQAASTIEKARLVNDLSRTNENLKRSQAALESSNRTLESRIAERTASLQAEVKEKERAQAEMMKSKEVAESATAQKSQFLANMSHEVRPPPAHVSRVSVVH